MELVLRFDCVADRNRQTVAAPRICLICPVVQSGAVQSIEAMRALLRHCQSLSHLVTRSEALIESHCRVTVVVVPIDPNGAVRRVRCVCPSESDWAGVLIAGSERAAARLSERHTYADTSTPQNVH